MPLRVDECVPLPLSINLPDLRVCGQHPPAHSKNFPALQAGTRSDSRARVAGDRLSRPGLTFAGDATDNLPPGCCEVSDPLISSAHEVRTRLTFWGQVAGDVLRQNSESTRATCPQPHTVRGQAHSSAFLCLGSAQRTNGRKMSPYCPMRPSRACYNDTW